MTFYIGRYVPRNSFLHSLDARIKLVVLCFYVILFFSSENLFSLLIFSVLVFCAIRSSKIGLLFFLKPLRLLWLFLLLIWIFQMIDAQGGVWLQWRFFGFDLRITDRAVYSATLLSLKLVLSFLLSSLFAATVTPLQLSASIREFLCFLRVKDDSARDFSMVFSLSLRFFPVLFYEAELLIKVQKSRGANFDYGSAISRLKAYLLIFLPLLSNTLKRANDLALALETRGYSRRVSRDSDKRARFFTTILQRKDWLFLLFSVGIALVVFIFEKRGMYEWLFR